MGWRTNNDKVAAGDDVEGQDVANVGALIGELARAVLALRPLEQLHSAVDACYQFALRTSRKKLSISLSTEEPCPRPG